MIDDKESLAGRLEPEIIRWKPLAKLIRRDEELQFVQSECEAINEYLTNEIQGGFLEMNKLDEQEMDVVVRREPAPKVLSWSVDVGLFGDRDAAESFGVVFEDALRAWGATPEPSESRDPMDGRG